MLDACEIGDDSYGYAYLSALLAERASGQYSVAIAADSSEQVVPRLLITAGWALAVVDNESTDDFADRFADDVPAEPGLGAREGSDNRSAAPMQRRALGLARALQGGALAATLLPPPAELTGLKPVLAAHSALATGRHAAAVALREVLRELYPAALRAYPDPADPVALAVMEALPEPGAVTSSTSGRGVAATTEAVANGLAEHGSVDQAAVTEAITALRVAVAETPRRTGVNRELAATVAETVRQSVAAVRACDAATTTLVNTLAGQVAAPRHRAEAPRSPAHAPATASAPPLTAPQQRTAATPHSPSPAPPAPASSGGPMPQPPAPTAPHHQSEPSPSAPAPISEGAGAWSGAAQNWASANADWSRTAMPPSGDEQAAGEVGSSGWSRRASGDRQGADQTGPDPTRSGWSRAATPPSNNRQDADQTGPDPTRSGWSRAAMPPSGDGQSADHVGSGPARFRQGEGVATGQNRRAAETWAGSSGEQAATDPAPGQWRAQPPAAPQSSAPPAAPTPVPPFASGSRTPEASTSAPPTNRPVSPPPPPGITPIGERRSARRRRAAEPRESASHDAASASPEPLEPRTFRSEESGSWSNDPLSPEGGWESPSPEPPARSSPAPRRAADDKPTGSRAGWPTNPPTDDEWANAPSLSSRFSSVANHQDGTGGYQAGQPESHNGTSGPHARSAGSAPPPWRSDDLQPPEPPSLRLVEPTLPDELRDDLGYSGDESEPARSEPGRSEGDGLDGRPGEPQLRLVEPSSRFPRSAPPVSADDDDSLLIFAQTRSAWFDQDEGASWNTEMDVAWRAAEQAAQPTVGDRTGAGLPRRVPHANLVPGAPPRRDDRPLRVVRDPASIAAHTSGYFNGWRRGQEVGGFPVGGRQSRQPAGAWEFHRDEDRMSG